MGLGYRDVMYGGDTAMLPMGSWLIGSMISEKANGTFDYNWSFASVPHMDRRAREIHVWQPDRRRHQQKRRESRSGLDVRPVAQRRRRRQRRLRQSARVRPM